MKSIILTFDLEYWFESVLIKKYLRGDENDSLEKFIASLLELLKNKGASATFFVTGKVLSQEPQLIKKIFDSGHEIAIHSLDHNPLWQKNEAEFDLEINLITEKIKKVTGKKPIGHRAPNFSIDQKNSWTLKILEKNGIKYDSSIFPINLKNIPLFKTSGYGSKMFNFEPYRINPGNISAKNKNSSFLEIPISVWHYKKIKIPATGGIFIRFIPWLLFKKLLNNKLQSETACLHFHPFDFYEKTPNIKMPRIKKIIKYYNAKNTWKKIKYIINKYECISAEQYIYENPID